MHHADRALWEQEMADVITAQDLAALDKARPRRTVPLWLVILVSAAGLALGGVVGWLA